MMETPPESFMRKLRCVSPRMECYRDGMLQKWVIMYRPDPMRVGCDSDLSGRVRHSRSPGLPHEARGAISIMFVDGNIDDERVLNALRRSMFPTMEDHDEAAFRDAAERKRKRDGEAQKHVDAASEELDDALYDPTVRNQVGLPPRVHPRGGWPVPERPTA